MNKQLQSILDELYALDPELRAQEKELVPILQKLMAHKPNATPDEAFVQKLRMMLREKAARLEPEPRGQKFIFLSPFFRMPSFNYAITGAILGAVITGPIVYSVVQNGGTPLPIGSAPFFSYAVTETNDEAFGNLSAANSAENYGRGGGGGAPSIDAARPQSGGGGGDMPTGDMKMIAPDMTSYNLIFKGEMPELTAQEVDIFQRQRGASNADMSAILRSFNTGLIDLDSFAGAKAESVSFYQDTQYGYMAYVNFREGSININANWEKWPQPQANCQTEECYQRFMPKITDVPSNDALVSIAAKFVQDHGIDLSQYGAPEVDTMWRANYETSADKSTFYIPDTIRVIYPLLMDGKPVYDEGGMKSGISVGVHIREKKVNDVWGIMDQKYLKSAYPAVTDANKITAYLENFGKMPTEWIQPNMTVKNVDITLGTPEMGFTRIYQYENNQSKELIVPALIFPVTNVPAGEYFYRNAVAVPLAQELLDSMSRQPEGRPMPIDTRIMEDVPALRKEAM